MSCGVWCGAQHLPHTAGVGGPHAYLPATAWLWVWSSLSCAARLPACCCLPAAACLLLPAMPRAAGHERMKERIREVKIKLGLLTG